MRPLSALVTAAVVVTMTATSALALAPTASASTGGYAALGDSYSSGVGTGNESGSCDQSPDAYGPLWDSANSPSSFDFAACSGATTSDVINTQVPTLSSSDTLVSLTIGGNDVGFSSTMETCILDGTSACVSAIDSDESNAQSILPGNLDNTIQAIRSAAPNAHIVMLDYPDFYDLSESSGCIGLSTTSRTAIDGGINLLDSLIQQAASRYSNVTFADVRSDFSGHEICDSNPWLHSTNFLDIDESYHPTAAGQQDGYLPALNGAVG